MNYKNFKKCPQKFTKDANEAKQVDTNVYPGYQRMPNTQKEQ